MTPQTQTLLLRLGQVLIGFAALCLATAFILTLIGGDRIIRTEVPASGGQTDTFRIDSRNTILDIRVGQRLPLNTWSDVTVSLVGADGEPLTAMGDGFWHENGVDADGYAWEEADARYSGRLVVHEPGVYRLQVAAEDNIDGSRQGASNYPIEITAHAGGFSYIPHFAAGLIALLGGVVLVVIGSGIAASPRRVVS